jgi:hypothetical protein
MAIKTASGGLDRFDVGGSGLGGSDFGHTGFRCGFDTIGDGSVQNSQSLAYFFTPR